MSDSVDKKGDDCHAGNKARGRIVELADLDQFSYARLRREVAKELKIRLSDLDNAVKALQKDNKADNKFFNEIEPWHEVIGPGDLATKILNKLTTYLALPKGAAVAIALWVLMTWVHDAVPVSPILLISSIEPNTGKTTTLDTVELMVKHPIVGTDFSPAVLYRLCDKWRPTILMDEADVRLTGRNANEELRMIFNGGYRAGNPYIYRCQGDDNDLVRFNVYTAKAIGMLGNPHRTIIDRSIQIPMNRAHRSDNIQRLRSDRPDPDFEVIRRQCARFAEDYTEKLRIADPSVPDYLSNRLADNWRVLLGIADVLGWRHEGEEALKALIPVTTDDDSARVQLLEDLRTLFEGPDNKRFVKPKESLTSNEIVNSLVEMEDRLWPEWRDNGKPITQPGVAKLLKGFKIKPDRLTGGKARGYLREQFLENWERYLSPSGASESSSRQERDNDAVHSDSASVNRAPALTGTGRQAISTLTDEKRLKPNSDAELDGLTGRTTRSGPPRDVLHSDVCVACIHLDGNDCELQLAVPPDTESCYDFEDLDSVAV